MEMYHFITRWFFQAPIDRVWDALNQDLIIAGAQTDGKIGVGTVVTQTVRGRLPYSLRFTIQVTHFEPPRLCEVTSIGDLVGTGKWVLEPRDRGTAVTIYWDVGTANPLFNLLAKLDFVKRVMARNHDEVMEEDYRRLRPRLETGMGPSETGALNELMRPSSSEAG